MPFQRNDIVLIPFPYTDLSATKTRPAVVVSSSLYAQARSELILLYVSSQVVKADPTVDYVFKDWKSAGLIKPSFVRPKIATIDPALIVHRVGNLSKQDSEAVDLSLRQALDLPAANLQELISDVDLLTQPVTVVQKMAEKAISAIQVFENQNNSAADVSKLRELLDDNVS